MFPNRFMRLLSRPLVAALVVALAAERAAAHGVATVVDTLSDLKVVASHDGDFTADATIAFTPAPALVNWSASGSITEDSGVDWDTLSLQGDAFHDIAPHGEPANTGGVRWTFSVDGSVEDENIPAGFDSWTFSKAPAAVVVSHVTHWNVYVTRLSYNVQWDEDILGYTFTLIGKHTDDPQHYRYYSGTLQSQSGMDNSRFGNAVGMVNLDAATLDMNAAVVGMRAADVMQALVRLGPPGGGGPILYLVGSQFVSDIADGVSIALTDAPIPPDVAQMIAGGQTHLQIMSPQGPQNDVSGMLEPVQVEQPCPGDLDGDGQVGLSDLAVILANYGRTDARPEDGDLDGDGDVDLEDLARMLALYGSMCR